MAPPRTLQPFTCVLTLLFAGVAWCPAESSRVLDSQVVDLGSHSITYNRVVTPVLKPAPAPVAKDPEVIVEQEETQQWDSKRYAYAFLSCIVYDSQFTEVEWYENGQCARFLTTINGHYLRSLSDFETPRSYYSMFMSVGDYSREEFEAMVLFAGNPRGSDARAWPFDLLRRREQTGKSAWRLLTKDPVSSEIMQAIADMHEYYDAHRDKLIGAYNESETIRLAQEQWLREHPPVAKDTVVEFFPIRSRHAPDQLGLKPGSQPLLR